MSGMSFTSATGPVHNPFLHGHTAGGSSSGSAALVAITQLHSLHLNNPPTTNLGDGADLALGADQGGSIRIPAAYSGIYGLKPTHGLVPYTGATSLHPAIDHMGPMAASLRDTALLLSVIAGWDGLDPRATPETPRFPPPEYAALLDAAIAKRRDAGAWTPTTAARGLRVGIVAQSFEAPQLSAEVAGVVRAAAERFRTLGAEVVEEVSIPFHGAMSSALFSAVTRADMADVFLGGRTPDLLSWPLPHLRDAPAPDGEWYDKVNAGPSTVVNKLLSGAYISGHREKFPLSMRGKAVAHALELRAAYDAALERYDVLLTPANPTVGPPHLGAKGEGVMEKEEMALGNTWNTCPFNLTGHPVLVIPVGWGKVEGAEGKRLPVGMQLVGKRYREEGVFIAAAAWEVGGLGLES